MTRNVKDEPCSRPGCDRPYYSYRLCSAHYQDARLKGTLPPIPERSCQLCGTVFTPVTWRGTYCTRECSDEARRIRKRAELGRAHETCANCGTSLAGMRRDARFCSPVCGTEHHNDELAAALLAKKTAVVRLCKGCLERISPERKSNALYCSDECKIRSRRHETYGLTFEELALLLAQHERCASCGSPEWGGKGPQVDHDHVTGRLRGVLCMGCNLAIGMCNDDPARLRAAADYLERGVVTDG